MHRCLVYSLYSGQRKEVLEAPDDTPAGGFMHRCLVYSLYAGQREELLEARSLAEIASGIRSGGKIGVGQAHS
jgi:hypothetical protein